MYNSYKTYPAVLFLGEYFKICEVIIYMISRKIMAPFSVGSVLVSSVDGQHIIVGNKSSSSILVAGCTTMRLLSPTYNPSLLAGT